tara:strand:+ start:2197 stop:3255 length:1059 start_codon:yes stop_codon:yes gene_type:complete
MKIVKKPSGYLYAVFKGEDGRQREVSTRTKSRAKANRIVKESNLEALEMAAQAQALTAESITRIVSGKRVTISQAINFWESRLSLRGRAPKTIHNSVSSVNRWVEELKLAHRPPAFVTHNHVHKYINSDRSKSKASSRRVVLSAIRSFLEFCCGEGWRVGNPAKEVDVNMGLLDHEQKETKQPNLFTADEVKHFVAVTDDIFWRLAAQLSFETGLRLGDICGLEWKCIDDGKITVWTGKRDKRVGPFKLSRKAMSLLKKVPAVSSKYVFPEQREIQSSPTRRALLSVQFKRHSEAAGLSDKSFHGLRHTYASIKYKDEKEKLIEKLQQELAELEVAEAMGHSSTKTTKGYIH